MNQLSTYFTLFSSWGLWRRFFALLLAPRALPRFSVAKVSLLLDSEPTYLLSWRTERTVYVSIEVAGKKLGWFPYEGYLKLQFNQEGPMPVVLKARSLFRTKNTRFIILVSTSQPEDIHMEEVFLPGNSYPDKIQAPKLRDLEIPSSREVPETVSPYSASLQLQGHNLQVHQPVFAEAGFAPQTEVFASRNIEIPPYTIDSPSLEIDIHLQP